MYTYLNIVCKILLTKYVHVIFGCMKLCVDRDLNFGSQLVT